MFLAWARARFRPFLGILLRLSTMPANVLPMLVLLRAHVRRMPMALCNPMTFPLRGCRAFRVGGADALLDRVMAGAAPHSETQTVAPPPKRSEAGLRGWANEHLQSTACRLRFRPKPPSDEKHGADAASRPGAVGALAWGQLNLTIRLENATAELMEASRRFGNPTLAALGRWLATTRANSANLVASAERFKRNFSCTLSPPAQARMAGAPPYDQDFLQYGYRLEPGSKA